MAIRLNPQLVYGTYKTRQRKYKVGEDGKYIKDENNQLIPDGWQYYTMHAVWANCLCALCDSNNGGDFVIISCSGFSDQI